MADQLQFRGGTSAEHDTFTGASKELTVDTDKNTLVVHDGSTVGGHPLVKESDVGTIAAQDADNVTITGGAISGITDLAISDGGTGASTAATARSNLGLGSIATQDADSVGITGGAIQGVSGSFNFDSGSAGSPSITFDGDTNTGLFRPAADTLAAATNGSEHMRITSAGNVGIGTSSALDKLQVDRIVQGSASRSFLVVQKNRRSASPDSVILTITVPADPFFIYAKMKYASSRAMGGSATNNVGTSQIGEFYFTISRNGSGSDVVIDENIGNLSFQHTTTTAGGARNSSTTPPSVQRAGAEANTDPQVVNVIVNMQTSGGNNGGGAFAFELLGSLYESGVVIT